jgi:hypothetical protein
MRRRGLSCPPRPGPGPARILPPLVPRALFTAASIMATSEGIELRVIHSIAPSGSTGPGTQSETRSTAALDAEAPTDRAIDALPPVDKGRDAWLFLVAAFIIETMVWGLPFSVVRAKRVLSVCSMLKARGRVSCTSTGRQCYSAEGTHPRLSPLPPRSRQGSCTASRSSWDRALIRSGCSLALANKLPRLHQRFPQHRAMLQAGGLLLSACGILASAFVQQVCSLSGSPPCSLNRLSSHGT